MGTSPFVEAGEAGLEEIISSIKGECATPSSSGLGPGPSPALDPPTFSISDIEALTNMFERLLIRRRGRQKILLKFTKHKFFFFLRSCVLVLMIGAH